MRHITFDSTFIPTPLMLLLATSFSSACSGQAKDLGDTSGMLNTNADGHSAATGTRVDPSAEESDAGPDSSDENGSRGTCEPAPQLLEPAGPVDFAENDLYGLWEGECPLDMELPSGSQRVRLTLAENSITLRLGELPDPRPLLDSDLVVPVTVVREDFEYSMQPWEVRHDYYDQDGDQFYQTFVHAPVLPSEPYDELCSRKLPIGLLDAEDCSYSCMPEGAEQTRDTAQEDPERPGICIVDAATEVPCESPQPEACFTFSSIEMPCDDVVLCGWACSCDESTCHFGGPGLNLIVGVTEQGALQLLLHAGWLGLEDAPGVSNGYIVVPLQRQQ